MRIKFCESGSVKRRSASLRPQRPCRPKSPEPGERIMNLPAPENDLRQIETLMATYIEGGRNGSIDTLRPIFHELATICGHVGPDLFAGPIEMFYDWHIENGPAVDLVTGDVRIDIEGSAASVRIELDHWTGHRFTDFFTLVKIDGTWKILSKVFYLHTED
jgi:hypothetical protein